MSIAVRDLESDHVRRQVLGWSLECELVEPSDIGRDLTLVDGPNGKDFARVEGMSNLGQALKIALTTLLGSDIFNTSFGFDGLNALAQETHPVLVRERVRVGVIQVLQRDARIRRVLDVQLGPTPSAAKDATEEQKAAARIRFQRILDLVVAFEVITGDESAVNLGR